MSEMIERVAMAIHAKHNAPDENEHWWHVDPSKCRLSRQLARVAIEAIREPTPQMRVDGGIAWVEALPDSETYVDTADACWKAMIDEALREPPNSWMKAKKEIDEGWGWP